MSDDSERVRRIVHVSNFLPGAPASRRDGTPTPPICPAAELNELLRAKAIVKQEDPMAEQREQARRWIVRCPEEAASPSGEMPVREPTPSDYPADMLPLWALDECVRRGDRVARWYARTESCLIVRTRTGQVLMLTTSAGAVVVDVGRRPEVEEL